jgi:excisionase family DNA binding protein
MRLQGYLTLSETARLLEKPEHEVRRRILEGEIQAQKVGAQWFIPRTALKTALKGAADARGN